MMKRFEAMHRWVWCGLILAGLAGCSDLMGPSYLDADHAPKGVGWKPLFNGKDLAGWNNLTPDRAMSWKVVDGVLTNAPAEAHGVNIYTDEKFKDFELYYEYRIQAKGNSGVFLRGIYEIQIVDDCGRPVDKPLDSGNGGLWSLKSPSKNVSKPAGQWQSVYTKLVGNRATVVLNGETIIDDFAMERPTHVYKELPIKHGQPGPILVQGDHKPVEYRCIVIRPIK